MLLTAQLTSLKLLTIQLHGLHCWWRWRLFSWPVELTALTKLTETESFPIQLLQGAFTSDWFVLWLGPAEKYDMSQTFSEPPYRCTGVLSRSSHCENVFFIPCPFKESLNWFYTWRSVYSFIKTAVYCVLWLWRNFLKLWEKITLESSGLYWNLDIL